MNLDIRRGDIFYIDRFGFQMGCEQRAGRPGVVVSCRENNRHSETVEVVYLTTAPKADLPTHVTILSSSRESTALCEQVTTVSVERLGNYIGQCTREEMFAIDVALLRSLGINIPELKNLQRKPEGEETGPKGTEADKKQGRESSVDKMEHTRLEAERDMYREMYFELLGRVVPKR